MRDCFVSDTNNDKAPMKLNVSDMQDSGYVTFNQANTHRKIYCMQDTPHC
jgi:hypothetical protein